MPKNGQKLQVAMEKIVTLSIKSVGISLSALIIIFLLFFLKETPTYVKILYYFFLLIFALSLAIIICGALFGSAVYLINLRKK
jgi:hypothetical protein